MNLYSALIHIGFFVFIGVLHIYFSKKHSDELKSMRDKEEER